MNRYWGLFLVAANLLCSLIPPFDWISVLCLVVAACIGWQLWFMDPVEDEDGL
jgi:predicted tellurium resistance membrane protein TerC